MYKAKTALVTQGQNSGKIVGTVQNPNKRLAMFCNAAVLSETKGYDHH